MKISCAAEDALVCVLRTSQETLLGNRNAEKWHPVLAKSRLPMLLRESRSKDVHNASKGSPEHEKARSIFLQTHDCCLLLLLAVLEIEVLCVC